MGVQTILAIVGALVLAGSAVAVFAGETPPEREEPVRARLSEAQAAGVPVTWVEMTPVGPDIASPGNLTVEVQRLEGGGHLFRFEGLQSRPQVAAVRFDPDSLGSGDLDVRYLRGSLGALSSDRMERADDLADVLDPRFDEPPESYVTRDGGDIWVLVSLPPSTLQGFTVTSQEEGSAFTGAGFTLGGLVVLMATLGLFLHLRRGTGRDEEPEGDEAGG